jgi:hypothetical protein
MASTPRHSIGPEDPFTLAERLYYHDVKKVFGIISHTILKTEQKSEPNGDYRCKEIIWRMNIDQILVNEWIEDGYNGHEELTQSPSGRFYYRSTSGNTIVETPVDGDTFQHTLKYYNGGVGTDPVFDTDDDGETPGYFDFTKFLDNNPGAKYIFELTDILAFEEAYIKHSSYGTDNDFREEIEYSKEKFDTDDYRKKRLEMHAILTVDTSSQKSVFQYKYKVFLTEGDKEIEIRALDDNYLHKAIAAYNKIDIRNPEI